MTLNDTQKAVASAYVLLEGCNHSARVIALKLNDIGIELTADEVAGICARCGECTLEPPVWVGVPCDMRYEDWLSYVVDEGWARPMVGVAGKPCRHFEQEFCVTVHGAPGDS